MATKERQADLCLDRRTLLTAAGAVALGAALPGCTESHASSNLGAAQRRVQARDVRTAAAEMAFDRGVPPQEDNGDEAAYPTRIGTYSKGFRTTRSAR